MCQVSPRASSKLVPAAADPQEFALCASPFKNTGLGVGLKAALSEASQSSTKQNPLRYQRTTVSSRPFARTPVYLGTLFLLWLVVYGAALFRPPLMDDVDSVHAEAAREILTRHDWVTLHANGSRYKDEALQGTDPNTVFILSQFGGKVLLTNRPVP